MKHISLLLLVLSFPLMTYAQRVTSKIEILENYANINSTKQMLSTFKGKPVFVDLWASWCEPCREEFKYKDELGRYLKKNRIIMLYVSIDKDDQDSTWKSAISGLKLYGYHIRANKKLMDQLTTLIWGAPGGFSIPNYLFFGKSGNIILKSALHPSNGILLYNQLRTSIKL